MLMMEKYQNNGEYNNIQVLFLSQICFRRAWEVSYEKYWNIGFNAFNKDEQLYVTSSPSQG